MYIYTYICLCVCTQQVSPGLGLTLNIFFCFRCLSSGDGHAIYIFYVPVCIVSFTRIRVKGLGARVHPGFRCLFFYVIAMLYLSMFVVM